MDQFGSNARFGGERVEVGPDRCVLPVSQDERRFPQGVGGLLPVVTQKKKGGEKTCYAFADGASEALEGAVELVNRMLKQAAQLSGYGFGQVGGVQVGVPEQGWGFTRVEVVPLDAHGQPSAAPLHLHVETCDEPGAPDSLSSVIEYDETGTPRRMVLTEFGPSRSCRILVTLNEKTQKFSVAKVEEHFGRSDVRLLYKRGWQPKEDDGRAGGPGRPAGSGSAGRPGGSGRPGERRQDGRGPARSGERRWDDRDGRGSRPRDDRGPRGDRRPGDRGGSAGGGRGPRDDFRRGDRSSRPRDDRGPRGSR